MDFFCYGLNHKTAPIAVREKIALPKSRVPQALSQIQSYPELSESFVLSTCNRTEYYLMANSPEQLETSLNQFVLNFHGIPLGHFGEHLYRYHNAAALKQLFAVVSGLDAMVVGEDQIVAQFKEAYGSAVELGNVKKNLHGIAQKALNVGKRVRSETAIGSNPASIASVAVTLAKSVFGSLKGLNCLLLGAGDNAQLILKILKHSQLNQIYVANRSMDRAQVLAQQFSGKPVTFETIPEILSSVDLVIASTGSPDLLLKVAEYQEALKKRRERYLVLLDLAVPRDIDPGFAQFENVFLYDIDDLQKIAMQNIDRRKLELDRAQQIIDEEVQKILSPVMVARV